MPETNRVRKRRAPAPSGASPNRCRGETMETAPDPLMEAARDLLAICRALNETTPAAVITESPHLSKADLLASAFRAVGHAVEVSRNLQDDPDRHGLDAMSALVVSVLLRRVARDLEREAGAWDRR